MSTFDVVDSVASVNKRRHQLQRNSIILVETTNLLNGKKELMSHNFIRKL
jgi:hypothetical protein